MALSEETWLGGTDKQITFKTVQKYMKVDDPRILESIHKSYLLGTISAKPYPIEAAVETAVKEVGLTQLARQRKEADGVPRRKHLKGDRVRRFLYPLGALKRDLGFRRRESWS